MPSFIFQSGKHRGKKFRLPASELLIGRDDECQIRLGTASDVSRRHCRVMVTDAGVVVRDLGSRNGTFVNDVSIHSETELNPGDLLRIGPMVLQLTGGGVKKPQAKGAGASASENDIADWLSDDDIQVERKESDTTIITSPPAQLPQKKEEPPKPQFRSLAEEAKDIIRRHWESVRERGSDES
ncbi:MAG: hypothetical protein CMJ48_12815 [Planctomycetaceae bacterium]|nr:hypothetical protein [Planctomycetaceae bacterium]